MCMEQLLPWFVLKSVAGIGNLLFRRLIRQFHTPEKVLAAAPADLCAVEGIGRRMAADIGRAAATPAMRSEINAARQSGIRILSFNEPDYPFLLSHIPDPPPYLYVKGELPGSRRSLAIVGSRKATRYGLEVSRRLATGLADFDIVVVSGMARGIDTAAHQGALQKEGPTIAVLGSGLKKIYPPENKGLYKRIVGSGGAVVSEFPLDAGPEAHHFPARNRIISGMTLGTVVVEAARRSGSLITARLAAEQNREVFAVPGSIDSYRSAGTHALIKEGARLVDGIDDVFSELPQLMPETLEPQMDSAQSDGDKALATLSGAEQKMMAQLDPYPVHVDELTRKSGLAAQQAAAVLLQLELKGFVRHTAGNLFQLANDKAAFARKGNS